MSERRGAEQRGTGSKAQLSPSCGTTPKIPSPCWGNGGRGGGLRNQEAGMRNPLEGREERSPFLQKMIPKDWEARQAGVLILQNFLSEKETRGPCLPVKTHGERQTLAHFQPYCPIHEHMYRNTQPCSETHATNDSQHQAPTSRPELS